MDIFIINAPLTLVTRILGEHLLYLVKFWAHTLSGGSYSASRILSVNRLSLAVVEIWPLSWAVYEKQLRRVQHTLATLLQAANNFIPRDYSLASTWTCCIKWCSSLKRRLINGNRTAGRNRWICWGVNWWKPCVVTLGTYWVLIYITLKWWRFAKSAHSQLVFKLS